MTQPLIVLGGTFDPPHIAHLLLAECAREELGGRVVFLPAGDPWRKAHRVISPATHRVAMTGFAIAGNPAFSLDAREVGREGPTYTVDTLEELRAQGHESIVLVLGADALADMPNWKAPDRIRALATLAVAARDESEGLAASGTVRIAMPAVEISSTMIRERVRSGRSIRYLVPDTVRQYIEKSGL
ncbi:MAG TPA: nicotinate-nucleotide adenylyltransferase, partial [Tepidiformaceae bacterium]|nr:nicotinate-nucleotide adenylyltransferase [Tepidiformaceae bacterium]